MVNDKIDFSDIVPVFESDKLGYEMNPIFPRIVVDTWCYQDIEAYEYSFQYMFDGDLISEFVRSRKEAEQLLERYDNNVKNYHR